MKLKKFGGRALAAASFWLACAGISSAGEIFSDVVPSKALDRELKFNIYLPDGYKDGDGPYPVIYLLHGAGGNEGDWRIKGGALETLDGLQKRGLMRPSVVVMPTTGPNTWWADSAVDKAETALTTDLFPYVEGKYKVARDRKGRAIAGLSMGGYGALNMTLRYPHMFCAAGIISPAIYDPLPPETSASRKAPPFERDGKFDPEIWKSLNYPAHMAAYQAQPLRVPMWIVSGDHDFLGIAVLSANLYWRMLQMQAKQAELRVIDGDHESMVFRDALPDALQYMDRNCAKS